MSLVPTDNATRFFAAPVIARQYAVWEREGGCTRALHKEYAQRHKSLERLIVLDGTTFRWEGLGNSGTRWMGLLRWGYATGRATFVQISREDQPRLDSDRRACFADPPSPYGCYGNRTQLIVLANAPHPCYLRDAAAARQFTNLVVAFAGGAMSRDMGSTPLHAYSAHVAAATAEPALSVRAAW